MLRRVLLTTDTVGGVWRYSIELARGIAARGAHVVLAVLGPPPDPAQCREATSIAGVRLVVTGLPLDWLADSPAQIEAAAQALASLAEQVVADTVQLHAPALVGDIIWPVPVIAVAHSCIGTWWRSVRGGTLPPDLAWRAEATARGLARADHVIAPSDAFATELRDCYGTARPIDVVWNGRTPMNSEKQRLAQVLTVGRLWDEGKNIAALDAAAAQLDCPVLAAGASTGLNGARATCRNVRMLGPLGEAALADEYARAAVFVSLSTYEPFGLAVLEAAQAGCALVLSDIPTFRELWDGAALLVSNRQPDRIAAAVESILRDPALQARQSDAARHRAAVFSAQRMADATWGIHTSSTRRAATAA